MNQVKHLEVYLWEQRVGAVELDPSLGFYVFAYDPKFIRSGIEISPLRMPLDAATTYVFTDLPIHTYYRLPAMLADALPDDFGNALIERWLAHKGIPVSQITALDRLAYMGNRAMGALEFKPSLGPSRTKPTAIEMKELVTEARAAIKGNLGSDKDAHDILREIIDVGTSAGGARAKAVISWNHKTNEILSGQLDAPQGFEHWLIKFDGMGHDRELGSSQDYGRIEFGYYLMAKACGINMTECRLLLENGRAHFMTKRFDRVNNQKIHMQTFCSMNHVDFKKKATNSYEQLLMTIQELKLPRSDLVEAYRRMVFNVATNNCDDHTKNFSFLLPQNSSWQLSPAYDVTYAYNPHGDWTHQHLMSVNGKFKQISKKDLLIVANRFGIGEAQHIITQVIDTVKNWPEFAKKTYYSV